ncbi:hypothetical protein [Glycomyces salinus]|uniref:hypothetical protein n=1 Tax=Glycomyces salinus TaxID=980294 RepID=UPI0018ED98CE|nr:hypothetical protein [Glycomyces salinus]
MSGQVFCSIDMTGVPGSGVTHVIVKRSGRHLFWCAGFTRANTTADLGVVVLGFDGRLTARLGDDGLRLLQGGSLPAMLDALNVFLRPKGAQR